MIFEECPRPQNKMRKLHEINLKGELSMENNSYMYMYAEVLDVLENMDSKYIDMLPKKLLEFFKTNASLEYKKHIVTEIQLKNQNVSRKALSILAAINLKYWVKDEEHKKKLIEKYQRNSKCNTIKINQEMFKDIENSNDLKHINNGQSMTIVKKESIFEKIIHFFSRRNKF